MLASTEIKPPSPSQLKTLTLADLVIMNKLSVSMREQIKEYVQIDPFTTRDPLEEKDDYEYSVILDKNNTNRIISIVAISKDTGVQLPWASILENYLVRLSSKSRSCFIKVRINAKRH